MELWDEEPGFVDGPETERTLKVAGLESVLAMSARGGEAVPRAERHVGTFFHSIKEMVRRIEARASRTLSCIRVVTALVASRHTVPGM